MVVRTILVEKGNTQVNKLNQRANRLVKASAQSEMIEKLKPYLTEEEMAVFKRTQRQILYHGKECNHVRLPQGNRI